ncbi:MAG: hypothetical protein S4CHLAM20_04730 [Chlamydiia bacterium]|nr:hypothetical protein [Chlamydiia bacterium]
MKGLKFYFLLAVAITPLWGIKHDPWIPPPYEMQAGVKYEYTYFPSVENGFNPSNYDSYVNQLILELSGSVNTDIFLELDVEFDNSRKVDFNFESVAAAIKYPLLNDLEGDPVALLIGAYFRYVPDNRLIDVATPYASNYNFDFLFSVGKEFDKDAKPAGKTYAYFDVGIAEKGYPWIIGDVVGEAYFLERNVFLIGVDGYFGLGGELPVDINNFNGYATIRHQSLEVKVAYQYNFEVWGCIKAMYKRRVFAQSYPQEADLVSIAYHLNFSF